MMLQGFRKSKKGFTLVEIIVVLIIIAILAAAIIPTMLGFVKDAKKKQVIAEARAVYIAAQMIATEGKAAGKTDATIKSEIVNEDKTPAKRVVRLMSNDVKANDMLLDVTLEKNTGKITKVVYVNKEYPDYIGTEVTIVPGKTAQVMYMNEKKCHENGKDREKIAMKVAETDEKNAMKMAETDEENAMKMAETQKKSAM